jgi:transposase-like protein
MVTRKLSDTDKLDLVKLYCRPGETTSTLATKYGVSSSTVSRVLKQVLSDEDYARLMQWKRAGEHGTLDLAFRLPEATFGEEPSADFPMDSPETAIAEPSPEARLVDEIDTVDAESSAQRRSRRRKMAIADPPEPAAQLPLNLEAEVSRAFPEDPLVDPTGFELDESSSDPGYGEIPTTDKFSYDEPSDRDEDDAVAAWVSEGLQAPEDYTDDEDYEEDDEDDLDDEDLDDDLDEDELDDEEDLEDWDGLASHPIPLTASQEQIKIRPFEDLDLQRPCYLVVDRLSELITCPLKEFAELGLIPAEEEQAKTLPVFDNHRIARRFARRNQKVIKLPDGLMLTKTQPHLQAKGIDRVLFDGQVYALS